MRLFILTMALLGCFATTASAQCGGGVCRFTGRPVARIVTAPVRIVRAIAVRPARRLIASRPFRRLFARRPIRRLAFRRWRR